MSSRWRIAKAALRWPDLRLRTRLAALLVAASLLPLALSAFLDIRQSQAQLLDSTKSLLRSGAEQIAASSTNSIAADCRRSSASRVSETTAFCLADAARRADTARHSLASCRRFRPAIPASAVRRCSIAAAASSPPRTRP
jgi:hypothetical protein